MNSCEWVGVCALCGREAAGNHLCEEMAEVVSLATELCSPLVQ